MEVEGLNVWFSNLGFNSTLYLDLLRSFMYKFDASSVRDCICIFFFQSNDYIDIKIRICEEFLHFANK